MTGPYYQDDAVTLWHGDARELTGWLSADVLVTDPPYGIGWKRGAHTSRSDMGHVGIANDQDTTVRDAVLDLWGDRPALVFGSFDAPEPVGVHHRLIFRKWSNSGVVGSVIGWRRDVEPIYVLGPWPKAAPTRSSVLTTTGGTGNPRAPQVRYQHPHVKPLDVMEQLVSACPPGAIADPCAGSGSTLIAARNLGRRAVGVELEERHCETIARRLSQDCLPIGATS